MERKKSITAEEDAPLPKCKTCGERRERRSAYVWREDLKTGQKDVWCVQCYFKNNS